MQKPSLSECVEQQSDSHTQLAYNVSELELQVHMLRDEVAMFAQPVKTQIKVGLETNLIKQDLKTTKNQLTSIDARLHALEKIGFKKDIEDKTRSIFWGYAKQALPLLSGLCAAMLVLGLTLDDIHLVKLILGQNS